MRDIERLKEKLKEDKTFKGKFKDVKSADEAILLAEKLGYKINREELEDDEELNEDLLEAVSGGKGITKLRVDVIASGKGSGYDESK